MKKMLLMSPTHDFSYVVKPEKGSIRDEHHIINLQIKAYLEKLCGECISKNDIIEELNLFPYMDEGSFKPLEAPHYDWEPLNSQRQHRIIGLYLESCFLDTVEAGIEAALVAAHEVGHMIHMGGNWDEFFHREDDEALHSREVIADLFSIQVIEKFYGYDVARDTRLKLIEERRQNAIDGDVIHDTSYALSQFEEMDGRYRELLQIMNLYDRIQMDVDNIACWHPGWKALQNNR